ncbi:hypothetical protein AC579_6423 [Pseudocercospora musae]|uniref:BZIP domain-containing protein n=1 Tax=Pseudocercospora musae TaxID=113226 RepID=A0A139I3V4_9PEZI|nr:hypothetical protein AC579_6423 [Pseudocercospora musae]
MYLKQAGPCSFATPDTLRALIVARHLPSANLLSPSLQAISSIPGASRVDTPSFLDVAESVTLAQRRPTASTPSTPPPRVTRTLAGTAHSALDNKRPAFIDDDDDAAVLDPSVLDADIMQSPNATAFRKDSFAASNGVLSPADSQAWDHPYSAGLTLEPASAGASNPFHHDEPAVYMRPQSSQHPQAFAHHHPPPAWPFEHASGDCTPTTAPDFMPPPGHFETNPHHLHQRADSAHGAFTHPQPHPPHFSRPHPENFIPAPQVQTPMSPHSHQDWMGMAQQEMESRPSHKRMRPGSPARAVIDFHRRDGIRKKNGRIDIPQERNIQTIDDLIEKTTDEELLKELKQQKRLLRNREAALASRQRKKKHTEDLESKEKNYTNQIAMLEAQLSELTREREARECDWQAAHQRLQEAQRIINTMDDEKREMVMRHNEEASQLRRRVQILADQLEAGPAPAMSAAPSSTGFTDFNAEMEALNMGPHDWDNFIFVNDLQNDPQDDFSFEPKPEPVKPTPELTKKSSSSTVTPASIKRNNEHTNEQPIASGLLFMLLLCGAFVASQPAKSQPPDLPKMPEDVRAAAPAVLNNLLAETGSSTSHDFNHPAARMDQHEPMPSGLPYSNNIKPGRIDRMHRTITSPTKQQEIDQAFSLTPAQYASMTNMDYPAYNRQSGNEPAPPQRRNLAEALANLENSQPRNSKAEVYTRSLLWDQIPADVVRQFKEIVRDHKELETRQQQEQQRRRPSTKLEQ